MGTGSYLFSILDQITQHFDIFHEKLALGKCQCFFKFSNLIKKYRYRKNYVENFVFTKWILSQVWQPNDYKQIQ